MKALFPVTVSRRLYLSKTCSLGLGYRLVPNLFTHRELLQENLFIKRGQSAFAGGCCVALFSVSRYNNEGAPESQKHPCLCVLLKDKLIFTANSYEESDVS